jgi:hypothetical protein
VKTHSILLDYSLGYVGDGEERAEKGIKILEIYLDRPTSDEVVDIFLTDCVGDLYQCKSRDRDCTVVDTIRVAVVEVAVNRMFLVGSVIIDTVPKLCRTVSL